MSEVEENAAAKIAAKQALEAEKARIAAEVKAQKEKIKIEKEHLKAQKLAEKEASRMPEQNGIRRPRPDSLCGKAWAIFDAKSAVKGTPAALSDCLEEVAKQSLSEGNAKSEYPRWRKFYGITGVVNSETRAAKKAEREALKAAKKAEIENARIEKMAAKEVSRATREAAKAEREALRTAKAEAKMAELAAKAQAKLDAKATA